MRVAHVCAYYAPAFVYGGPPRSVHGLCSALQRNGADVCVFTTDANGDKALPPGITAAGHYEGVAVDYFPRSWPAQPIGSGQLTRALRRRLASVDVLHIHGLWNRVVWAAAREARRAGVPYILSPRGMLEDGAVAHHAWRKRAAYALLERRTIADAARIHATSDREAASIRQWHPLADIVCIPNGIDGMPSVCWQPPAAPAIIFVGRLHPIKRLDLLVDAFVSVRRRHSAARLVIAGPDEFDMQEELRTRAGDAAAAIEWTGAVDAAQRTRRLAESSALVLCSDSESFGMSVLEAMSVGLPVVATDTCGWSDVATHEAGAIVPQRADAIADALCRIIEQPEEACAMGRRGAALVLERYRWDTIARRFLRTYGQVVEGRGALASAPS